MGVADERWNQNFKLVSQKSNIKYVNLDEKK